MPSSTGVIGHLYDFAKFKSGAADAVRSLREDGLSDFAHAIMTTDTRAKIASTTFKAGGATITLAGAVKGVGMISPKMATMLGYLVTDALIAPISPEKVAQSRAADELQRDHRRWRYVNQRHGDHHGERRRGKSRVRRARSGRVRSRGRGNFGGTRARTRPRRRRARPSSSPSRCAALEQLPTPSARLGKSRTRRW